MAKGAPDIQQRFSIGRFGQQVQQKSIKSLAPLQPLLFDLVRTIRCSLKVAKHFSQRLVKTPEIETTLTTPEDKARNPSLTNQVLLLSIQ
jgi:hypothetical protein